MRKRNLAIAAVAVMSALSAAGGTDPYTAAVGFAFWATVAVVVSRLHGRVSG